MINMVACHTFAFVDQLVIMFCIGLDEFFDDFNKRIGQERRQKLQPREWRTFRTDYTRLCNLVASVDRCVCHLLFSSFAMHLFTICIELHHSMLLSADREERSHIIFSFIIAGGQACALCFFTVRVHDKSREPLNILYAVPSISYCQEVEIFLLQILKNHVVLTGGHLFSMTRRFLLTIVGTMLSYEVLLLQLRILTAGKATVGDG
nr:PREDICTED: gustatory receptor for sugar taste 64f-like [Bemisia tabaci]